MENQIPSLGKLFSRDIIIRNTIGMVLGPLIFFFTVRMMDSTTMFFLPYITLPITAIGIFVFIFRYFTVASTFRDGITVKGKVEHIEKIITRRKKGSRRTSHYANISYSLSGEPHQSRIKLPGDPTFYGISDNQEIDLVLKEEKPKNAFIKHIYLD